MVDDRRRAAYEEATTLSQSMLDECFRGGNNDIQIIATLTKPLTATVTVTIATPAVVTHTAHGLANDTAVTFATSGSLPTGIVAGTSYYVRNAATNTYELSATAGGSSLATSGSQSGSHRVSWVIVTLRFADQPKFVGDDFYEGRASFPEDGIVRTLGDPQSPTIKFSQIELPIANLDGFYNAYLEGGASYFSPIGARIVVELGLADIAGSFFTIFDGFVPDEDGFDVQRERITIRATDRFNDLNRPHTLPSINTTDFPTAPADVVGKIIPLVLGNWEAGFNVTDDTGTVDLQVSGVTKTVRTASPAGFYGGVLGYYVGGGFFVFSIGTYTPDTIAACYVKRGDTVFMVDFDPTPQDAAGYWVVEVTAHQVSGGGTTTYTYQNGDVAVISVKVPYASGKYSNPIEIAQQLMMVLAGKIPSEFGSSWATLAAKSTPAQSDMTSLKQRKWIAETNETVLQLVLDMLEEVRCEMSVDRHSMLQVSTLHPEDFPAPSAATRIDQVEMVDTPHLVADDKTFFNQCYINYAFTPVTGKTALATTQLSNENSVMLSGKRVAKIIDCPSLYVESDVVLQQIEFIRLYSTGLTFLEIETAWVHLLRDLGDFVAVNFATGSLVYAETPMMIRDLGIRPKTGGVTMRLLSLANFPYTGWSPSNSDRMLSSASQSISEPPA